MATVYTSDLPRLMREFERQAEAATRRTAERVADRARANVPADRGFVKETIDARPADGGYEVVAGGKGRGRQGRGFYAHILEFGGAGEAPRPFLVPAAEAEQDDLVRGIRGALDA